MFNFKHLAGAAAGLALAVAAIPAAAEDFPNGSIEVINNSKPGGGSDIFLRFATEAASEALDTPFIHLSKTGGVATNTLKYAMSKPADGQTLFIVNAGTLLTIMRGSVDGLTFDDIQPLVRGTVSPNYLVVKAGRFEDMDAFVEFAKNNTVKQGGTNVGGNPHVEALMFRNAVGMQNQVYVPFEQTGEIVINLVRGNIDAVLLNLPEFETQWKAGEVVPLAVMLPERASTTPDVPSSFELGYELEFSTVRGIGVRAGTPPEVVDRLEATLLESMRSPAYIEYLKGAGQDESAIAGRDAWTEQLLKMNEGYTAVAQELLGG